MRVLTAEQKLAARQYQIAYRAKNSAALQAKKAAYYASRREYFRKQNGEYRAKNRETLNAYDRERRAREPEKKRALDKAYWERNRDAINEKRRPYFHARASVKASYDRQYSEANKDRIKQRQLTYYAKNKPAYVARVVKRNAQKLRATPAWANEFFIEEAYRLSELRTKMLGYRWHVDHIVPLQSPFVCGLHVESNLRVIPGVENLRKGNRVWPDMP